MITFAVLAASAVTPSLLLVWYFHARDAFPEPPRVLWTTFALGALSVAPVLLFAWPMYMLAQEIETPLAHGLASAFLGAAIPEEAFKLLVLWGYSMRQRAFDEPMDGIVYGATASLGFATLENVLYVSTEGGSAAILRAFTAVPGHALLGAIMGYYVGKARFASGQQRRSLLLRAFAVPTLLHGGYDFPLMAASKLESPDTAAAIPILLLLLLVPAVLCIEWIWTLRLVRGGRRTQLAGGPPAPAPVAVTAHPPARAAGGSNLFAWLLTVFGVLGAAGGGLVVLAVVIGVLLGGSDPEELRFLVLGTGLIGVIPAAAGTGLFAWGVRRLNRAG
ncbi:MAG: PrsW family intramembrane metalloprotease [bacterium]|nr:PrsW family intramembrane metalloprotease [bacterium]